MGASSHRDGGRDRRHARGAQIRSCQDRSAGGSLISTHGKKQRTGKGPHGRGPQKPAKGTDGKDLEALEEGQELDQEKAKNLQGGIGNQGLLNLLNRSADEAAESASLEIEVVEEEGQALDEEQETDKDEAREGTAVDTGGPPTTPPSGAPRSSGAMTTPRPSRPDDDAPPGDEGPRRPISRTTPYPRATASQTAPSADGRGSMTSPSRARTRCSATKSTTPSGAGSRTPPARPGPPWSPRTSAASPPPTRSAAAGSPGTSWPSTVPRPCPAPWGSSDAPCRGHRRCPARSPAPLPWSP